MDHHLAGNDGGPHKQHGLGRILHRLTANADDLQADTLHAEMTGCGATPIASCQQRERVCVAGTLRTVTVRPRPGVPVLEADLWDGSDSVTLVWLGRREIHGISPGRNLVAKGVLSGDGCRRVIFNPEYELRD